MRRFSQHWIVGATFVAAGVGLLCVGVVAGDPPHESPAGHDEHAPTPKTQAPAAKASPKAVSAKNAKSSPSADAKAEEATTMLDAAGALAALVEGNSRWADGKSKRPHSDTDRMAECAAGQHPFVSILACSDSRVPVEEVFDQGVGDIFTIRVAGNVAGPSESGTIEYGLEHLKTPLLVVLGHTRCGAVTAAATHADVSGNVATLVTRINPAVDRASRSNPGMGGKDLVPASIRENVWQSVTDLLRYSPVVRKCAEDGTVRVVGAIYDVESGKVEWLGDHPWQAELVDAFNARDQLLSGDTQAEADAESHGN